MQGELEAQDGKLQQAQQEKVSLEEEVTALLEHADISTGGKDGHTQVGAGSKGPGAMLHSALQQLQAELKREALANEKLMVKAETLLKGGGSDKDDADGNSSHATSSDSSVDRGTSGVRQGSTEEQEQLRHQLREMAQQVQHREKENERLKTRVKELQQEATYDPSIVYTERWYVACMGGSPRELLQHAQAIPSKVSCDLSKIYVNRSQAAQAAETNPELKQLMNSLEKENETLRDKVQSMGHILKANQQTVGAYIANSQQVLQRAGMADKQRTRSRSPR